MAILRRDRVALPGAITAALVYALLGTLTLLGHAWARWVLFTLVTLVTLTALTCALFAFVDLSGGRAKIVFTPTLAVVALVAALVAAGVAAPLPRRSEAE